MFVSIKSKYVDLNDINNPIKSYLVSDMDFQLLQRDYHFKDIFIERNEVVLQDDWVLNLLNNGPKYFNSFGKERAYQYYTIEDSLTLQAQIRVRLSDKINQYNRKIVNLLEVTGTLGGIFEISEIVIGICISFITSYIHNKDLRRDLNEAHYKLEELRKIIKK